MTTNTEKCEACGDGSDLTIVTDPMTGLTEALCSDAQVCVIRMANRILFGGQP